MFYNFDQLDNKPRSVLLNAVGAPVPTLVVFAQLFSCSQQFPLLFAQV